MIDAVRELRVEISRSADRRIAVQNGLSQAYTILMLFRSRGAPETSRDLSVYLRQVKMTVTPEAGRIALKHGLPWAGLKLVGSTARRSANPWTAPGRPESFSLLEGELELPEATFSDYCELYARRAPRAIRLGINDTAPTRLSARAKLEMIRQMEAQYAEKSVALPSRSSVTRLINRLEDEGIPSNDAALLVMLAEYEIEAPGQAMAVIRKHWKAQIARARSGHLSQS